VFTKHSAFLERIEEVRLPFQSLFDAAAGFGYINADFECLNPDGVIQKAFLLHRFEDHWMSNYPLAVAEQTTGKTVVISDTGIKFRGKALPVIDMSPWKSNESLWRRENSISVYINYLGSRYNEHFRNYSFADILENRFNPADIQNAVVLVGPSAIGLGDLKLTPYGMIPGVVIHANLLDNILADNFLKSPTLTQQVLIIAGFAFLTFCFLCWEGSFVLSTIIHSLLLSTYVIYCFMAFSLQRLVLPITVPILMSCSQYIVTRFFQLIQHLKLANFFLKEQNIKLDHKVNELMDLHSASLKFPSILETCVLSREIIKKFCEFYCADAGLLVHFEKDTGQPCFVGSLADNLDENYVQSGREEFYSCLDAINTEKRQLKVSDSSLFTTYIPLLIGDSCWGAICLHETQPAEKRWQSEYFWTTLLGICSTALENARLYEMAREVSLAKQVQENFLPKDPLEFNGYRVCGNSRPATQLGGDYFDYFIVEDRFLVVLIADVMGHGVPAALGMTIVKTSVLQHKIDGFSIEKLINTINTTLLHSQGKRLMVTAQFVVIDTVQHTGMIYHRGHVFPFRRAVNSDCLLYECIVAPPLGVKKNVATPGVDFCISPGERWILYTDGLVESLVESLENTMKIAAFKDYLDARPHFAIKEACADIIDHHPSLQTGSPQPDDYTVVIFERGLDT